jgi:outer membrane protein insertion porin family
MTLGERGYTSRRTEPRANRGGWLAAVLGLAGALAAPAANAVADTDRAMITEVRVEGNQTIPTASILPHIRTRAGRPFDSVLLEGDVARLFATRWFLDVKPLTQSSAGGLSVVFQVFERPFAVDVSYVGNKNVKTKTLEDITGLRPGSPIDVTLNQQARKAIADHYRKKGYAFAEVELLSGASRSDRKVIFQINEGPKVKVTKIDFVGNSNAIASDALLATKIQTKPRQLYFFGGAYEPEVIENDVRLLRAYYQGLGFFDADVRDELRFSADRAKVELDFLVTEGTRHRVRNVEVVGNSAISTETLMADLKLRPGDYFSQNNMAADVRRIEDAYGVLGHIYVEVKPEPKFLDENGVMDLEYRVSEGEAFRIREVRVEYSGSNSRTKKRVPLNLLSRELVPGELINTRKVREAERRLRDSQLFVYDPKTGVAPRIEVDEPDPYAHQSSGVTRAQYLGGQDYGGASSFGDPYAPSNQPDVNDPFLSAPGPVDLPPPGYRDIVIGGLEETQTGRLLFGVGVNSDAGPVGSILLDERNFDITRYPRNFDEILDGTAFRGAGQQLRIEAVPGSEVSRYMVTFREPYLFDLPLSFGTSGYYYQRYFDGWDEERLGGRITLGHSFTDYLSGTVGARLENVNISDPDVPTPPDLAAVLGDSFLGVFRASLAHDTRDSPFLPTEGHFVEAAYEQGFGDYNVPRGTLEGRQYFLLRQRPDGTGRQVLGVRGEVGLTGSDTPIFERFFAGGFQSMRGFDFRGVGPRVFGTEVGGEFQLLGSVEYMFPLIAADTLHMVVFSDFGTVEESVKLTDDFRVSLGAGLRVTLPAMGPVPIALDFAVPLHHGVGDDIQNFSFFIGFFR